MEAIDKLRELSKKLDDPYFIKEFEEGFEKFLKERDMKIYHTRTLEDYDALMVELEEKGCKSFDGKKPTIVNLWSMWKETTCLRVDKYVVFHGSLDYYKEKYPSENIIKYKAKGTKMTQEEIKQKLQVVAKLHEVAFDISVAIGTFARGTLTVESNLSEAKSSAKKLIEKIDEYLESQEPEFKVGDYVSTITNRFTGVVEQIKEQNGVIVAIVGKLYDRYDGYIRETQLWGSDFRKPTPEEIAEYESVLIFHKHGRKPFEVKKDDILLADSDYKFFVDNPEIWGKEDFVSRGYTFAKTAEEVNEWIKGE